MFNLEAVAGRTEPTAEPASAKAVPFSAPSCWRTWGGIEAVSTQELALLEEAVKATLLPSGSRQLLSTVYSWVSLMALQALTLLFDKCGPLLHEIALC